jgi:hypothetical protein
MLAKMQVLGITLAIGAGVLVASAPGKTSAATLLAPGAAAAAGYTAEDRVLQIATRDDRRRVWRYDRRYHGPRYRYPYRTYKYYYGGYWYNRPYWNIYVPLPFIAVPPVYVAPRYRNYSAQHINWCMSRYRSYNVRTNTWVSYSGQVRQCISPFGP